MGLQIWLPLNGNLNNQGINKTITITNNGATVDTNGKIGQCYSLNGSGNYIQISNLPNPKSVTVAFWMKRNVTTNSRQFMFTAWYGVTCELTASNHVHCYVADSHGVCDSTNVITVDTGWVHVAYTFEDKVGAKLYLNGVLDSSVSSSNSIHWTTTTGRIGNYSNMYFNGCINDFRFYDHCLSPEEVKRISEGLVLHYPLSNRGFGGDNIIKNSWPEERIYTYPSSSYSDKFSPITTIVPSASKYTLSFYAKSTVNGDKIRTHYYSPNTTTTCVSSQGITKTASDGNMDFTLSTSWKRYWVTYTQNETTAVKHVICPRLLSGQGTGTISIKGIKFEEGEKATAWIPNSADTLYSSLQLGSTAELDCSGYQYNGIKNNVVNGTDSLVNQGCYVFNGTDSWVKCDTNAWMVQGATEFTVNWWACASDWTAVTNGGRMVSCTESGGFNTEGGATGYLRFPHYVFTNEAKTSRAYQYNNNGIKLADLTPGWHMFTLIYNLAGEKIYIDGTLHSSANSTSYGISFNTNARLYLGCEANSASPYIPYFNGKMSDFRFYYTELDEDAIKELYMMGNKI